MSRIWLSDRVRLGRQDGEFLLDILIIWPVYVHAPDKAKPGQKAFPWLGDGLEMALMWLWVACDPSFFHSSR
jgi:hypothetical protein